jgi:phosphatidylglycerol:prolipoprotein diacylglycerol transferase
MLIYPNIDPVAFHVLQWPIYWYGIMYFISFVLGWGLLVLRNQQQGYFTNEQIADLLFYVALGVIFGGRVGYLLFYDWQDFWQEPWLVLQPWKRGMSFHGGVIGVSLALVGYSWRYKVPFLLLTDFIVPVVPVGLGLGRLGNFINGELWGRVTDVPWAMIFAHVDLKPRHPSQLYEFLLEGVLLLLIMWVYARKMRPLGHVSGVFLVGYGLLRIIVESWREPDIQIGLLWQLCTAGQLLSIPMIGIGVFLLLRDHSQDTKSMLRCNMTRN